MEDGAPSLEVGFLVDTGGSFDELMRLQAIMESTEGKIIRDAANIERATGGMVNLGGATASIRSFGNAATREYQTIARESARAEKAGEAIVRRLDREIAAFGKSRSELRSLRNEEAALAAARVGNSDLAARIRAREAQLAGNEAMMARAARYAAEDAAAAKQRAADEAVAAAAREAQALREAAFAHQMFQARVREGVTAMREQEAAARAAAAAEADLAQRAQRLVAEINPAAAAQQRFNSEIAEARTLIAAGAISLDDYVEKLRLERTALEINSTAKGRAAASAGALRQATLGASYQVQDLFTQISMGANPINAFAVQGAQLAGQFASVEGKAGALARFFIGPWGLAITGAVLAGGMLTKGLFENDEATGKLTLNLDMQKNSYDVLIRAVREYNETQRDSATLTRQATEEAKKQTDELIKQAKVRLAEALASERANAGQGVAGAAGAFSGGQASIRRAELLELQKTLREIEKGLANQDIEGKLNKEVEIATRYGKLLNALTAGYDAGTVSLQKYTAERERLLRLQEKELDIYRAAKREADRAGPSAGAIATRDARVGDMVALIKELFPGARITSTTGGRHTKGSDHYSGRAIDFVPGGGMGQYTTAEVEQILKNAGVDIRRNARGTQQLFGPGRSAGKLGDHDDHFHVAWQGSPDTDKVESQKAAALAEMKRQYDLTVKAAQDYAAAQRDEAAKTGLSAKELRLYADAAAIAKAPTDDLKQAIRDAATARETAISATGAADFDANIMRPLRDELALYGLVGPARARAALELEKEAFMARYAGEDAKVLAERWKQYSDAKLAIIDSDDAAAREAESIRRMREEMDALLDATRAAGDAIGEAFGRIGRSIGDAINILVTYQQRERAIADQAKKDGWSQAKLRRENNQLALEGITAFTGAAKDMFKEHSAGYKAMAAAEKAFALVQLANTAVNVAAGAAKMFASLGPWAFPAVAAMIGVMASLGFRSGGKSNEEPQAGTGTVLGDRGAQSESIVNAINALRQVDTTMLGYSRQMAASLRTIESSIGGVASLLVRGEVGSADGVKEGFNSSAGTTLAGIGLLLGGPIGAGIGALLTKIPVVGDILKGLFGTKTTVLGSGLYGGSQSLGSILGSGYDASTYTDIQKKKKFLGITTSNKTSTQYGAIDPALEAQFTLILRSFNDAILAAAGPLGVATTDIQQRLNSFVFSLGKIDLRGLTGEQIQEKLSAVFGAAADNMARAAFPGFERFQKVGEGLFETLIRVASTVEAVSAGFSLLGNSAVSMSIDTKLALADHFDSVSALASAVGDYFSLYYSQTEQAAARTAQMASVFQSLGLTMPSTLASFRALVEAQDLNTAAGRETYATLLKLAPAFADLQGALEGAKSAADIATERADLQRQLLELRGDTTALRDLQLARLDASNRALQLEIWAIQDAQAAAKAADELRKAWQGVGDSIADEVRRIRGLTDTAGAGGYAALLGQFNAATSAARGGDMDAAKSLPQLSQALLAAALETATSRQELDRIRAMIAANLEQTNSIIGPRGESIAATNAALLNAGASSQPGTAAINDNGSAALAVRIDELREELAQQRTAHTAALAQIAANTGSMKRTLDNVTAESGGDAVSTVPRDEAA